MRSQEKRKWDLKGVGGGGGVGGKRENDSTNIPADVRTNMTGRIRMFSQKQSWTF